MKKNYCQLPSFRGASQVILQVLLVSVLSLAATGSARAQALSSECGSLNQSWGPFDYRPERYIPENTYRSHAALLAIVEHAHFTPEVETLIRGKTGNRPAGDLSYTLGVFPNHHRALVSISNLGLREKSPKPAELRYSIECFFQRAIVFRPDDNIVLMIYANHLIQTGKSTEAEKQIDFISERNPDNPFTLRNLGLLYFEIKNYEKSLAQAHKAEELGLNVHELKEKLASVGKWQDLKAQKTSDKK